MAEKLNLFYKLLKVGVPININSELKETFDSVNRALSDACQLALKQPIPGKQLVLMTDASFRRAGYALMIEDNPDQKIQSKRKTYAPVAFGSKNLSPAQLKMSIHSKEFLAIYMEFLEFAHILWETSKPTIVLTDNKSVNRFFSDKSHSTSLWNACEYVMQFNFKKAHIAGSVNTAADSLSRLELKATEKIHLKIREDVQTTPIAVSTASSDVPFQMKNNSSSRKHIATMKLKNKSYTKRTISKKGSRMGSKPRTILNEAKYQRIHKDWRKHYVVLHQRN